ncbi:GNAT family N-acetyltransferase [Bacillus horti]|uniref:GNAT superfamily N-acetyltransferase n=1 Tax=Caldalkalibacillus horti TaxID=77523 RepID=A0ABT9W242_9BACI|nr:GNAT family N-acetyltransferase [Bacillus horti]MDQ0167316.1 GNAT superfamily N-acetyltransferase [Bacillus horti]
MSLFIKVRLAKKEDVDQLVKMRWDFTNEHRQIPVEDKEYDAFYDECKSFLLEAIHNGRWFIWVAETEEQIVSHIYIELINKVPRPGRKTNPFTYMTNVYTLPEYRGKGIGSQLLQEIESWSKDNEYKFIIVWPSDESIDFYKRNGYKLCNDPMELVIE